jgi:hypothetical protein
VDAVSHDDRGQALLIAVVAMAVAAVAIAGLLGAQERLIDEVRERRDGEGAAAAAGTAVADAHLAYVRALRDALGGPRDPTSDEEAAFIADPALRERALAAARDLVGAGLAIDAVVRDAGALIEIEVRTPRSSQRVTIEKVTCCRP